MAAAAKLCKREFKPPNRIPHNYDQQPFRIDGHMDLDVSFLNKIMKTPVYVKMDAHEPLLLSEGICRQMGIITYHPEVKSRKAEHVDPAELEPGPKQQNEKKSEDSPKGQVPIVRVKLVQSIKLPPNQTVMAEVKLSDGVSGNGPMLLEPDLTVCQERGVQVADSVVMPSEDGIARVMITNCLGMSQRAEMGMEVGIATPTEVIDPLKVDSALLLVECTTNPHSWDPSVVLGDSDQEMIRRLTSKSKVSWRRQQLCDMLNKEFPSKDPPLPDSQKKLLISLLEELHDMFALEDGERGETDLVRLHIETGDATPIAQSVRRVPFAVRKEVARQLQEMQRNNVIQPSHSPWASPIVLVRKKDNTLSFCVDYRALNEVTKLDKFPIPRINDLLDQLGEACYFSTLDLAAGYWQIQVDEASQEKTAFVTHQGLFEFRVMPFGLTNAPSVFQRVMQQVLSGLNPADGKEFVEVYIDDVLIFSRTIEEHIHHLCKVLEQLRSANLKLKPTKCHFLRQSLEYLGHIITPTGLKLNPKQLEAVQEFPVPTSVSQVRQFLGLMSYYRRFIKNFATIASLLHSLTRKNAEFVWSEECQLAFDLLKQKLTTAPVLVYPNFNQNFVLETDASIKGLGAVLSQRQEDNQLHPVAFSSRALSAAEKNYSITELETLAVVWAIQHYHAYLYGHEVTVITDHSAVTLDSKS